MAATATGGLITKIDNYIIHTLLDGDDFVVSGGSLAAEWLIIAGGGAGDTSGGDAGGYETGSGTLTAGTYPVTVGAGGAVGNNGSNSTFNGTTATGGDKGTSTAGGGDGSDTAGTSGEEGAGGDGLSSSITGAAVKRGGGGGSWGSFMGGPGGEGGGGDGGDDYSNAEAGQDGTGSGGGGAGSGYEAAGGNGIVIIRYVATTETTEAKTPTTFQTSSTEILDICALDPTYSIILYTNYAVCVSLSGTTLTAGTPLSVTSTNGKLCAMDSTHAILCYKSGDFWSVCLTRSGTTLSLGTANFVANMTEPRAVCALDSTHAIAIGEYQDNAVCLTLSGTTVSEGSVFATDIDASTDAAICKMDSTHAIAVGGNKVVCITLSGTTVSEGAEITLYYTPSAPAIAAIDSAAAVIASPGKLTAITLSGTTVTEGLTTEFETATTKHVDIAALSDSALMVAYNQDTANEGNCCLATADGAAVTAFTPVEFSANDATDCKVCAMSSTISIIAYSDDGDSGKGKVVAVESAVSVSDNYASLILKKSVYVPTYISSLILKHGAKAFSESALILKKSVGLQHLATLAIKKSAKKQHEAQLKAGRLSFAPDGWDIYVNNTYQGFIASNGAGTLTNVSLSDGDYSIEARPSGNFWQGIKSDTVLNVTISGGEVVAATLPAVESLRALNLTGWGRDIYFTYSDDFATGDPTDFGLWFGAASPVDVSGDPVTTVTAAGPGLNYSYRRAQTAAEYIAVRARAGATLGPVSELLLDYPADAVTGPEWQTEGE